MTAPFDPLGWLAPALEGLDDANLRRVLRTHDAAQRAVLLLGDREVINFGSNDYLGLAADPRLQLAVVEAMQQVGWGAGASPLVVGHSRLHEQLEAELARFLGTEAALVFPSGYAANSGTIPALVSKCDHVFSDELNHASIVDGCRLSGAEIHVYRHADPNHLASLLTAAGPGKRLIVTDSLFSMDGDVAPLAELSQLAEQHGVMLAIDEAHATGVFGDSGRGLAEHLGVEQAVHVRIGTLSKALGGSGGFVAGRRELIDWLVNRARPYVFSTAHPAAGSAASRAALEIVGSEPWRSTQLLITAAELRIRLSNAGWNVGASTSQIIPLVVGESQRALELSARLLDAGFFIPAIRAPSVPEHQARLRLSLTTGHTAAMIDQLCSALGRLSQPEA